MTANNQKIESILGDQQEVMAGTVSRSVPDIKLIEDYIEAVERLENDVNAMKKGGNSFDKNFSKLESDIKALQDRRNLDEMVNIVTWKK